MQSYLRDAKTLHLKHLSKDPHGDLLVGRSYKVYQAKYLIPKSDKGPAFTLNANPAKFHAELHNDGKLCAFITRDTYAEARAEGENHVRRDEVASQTN